eukprot:2232939-Karenia_brevis.AAC.1
MKFHNRMTESSLLVRTLLEESNNPFILLTGDEMAMQLIANAGFLREFLKGPNLGRITLKPHPET